MMVAPVLDRPGRGGLDPQHVPPSRAHRPRDVIDGWYNLARERNFGWKAFGDEVVLHVDHDQRSARSNYGVVAHELALAAHEPLLNAIGKHIAVHRRALLRLVAPQIASNANLRSNDTQVIYTTQQPKTSRDSRALASSYLRWLVG